MTAVIRRGDEFLVVRGPQWSRWSLVGGRVEPGEDPRDAVTREVQEELGVRPEVRGIVGAYGGTLLEATYPDRDRVGCVTVAFACTLPESPLRLETSEILAVEWRTPAEIRDLPRDEWVDRVLADAAQREL